MSETERNKSSKEHKFECAVKLAIHIEVVCRQLGVLTDEIVSLIRRIIRAARTECLDEIVSQLMRLRDLIRCQGTNKDSRFEPKEDKHKSNRPQLGPRHRSRREAVP